MCDNVGMVSFTSNSSPSVQNRPALKMNNIISLADALRDAGVTSRELFGRQKTAFRRVNAVSSSHVSLDFGSRVVELPQHVFPIVDVDQWVRFDRCASGVTVALDLRATLRAEARLSTLFQRLVPH
jgi:hypothetical protein